MPLQQMNIPEATANGKNRSSSSWLRTCREVTLPPVEISVECCVVHSPWHGADAADDAVACGTGLDLTTAPPAGIVSTLAGMAFKLDRVEASKPKPMADQGVALCPPSLRLSYLYRLFEHKN